MGALIAATFVAGEPGEPPSVFAGPYEIEERVVDGVRFRTYFHPELAEFAEGYLDDSAAHVARYSEEIGPYPFADFHVISAPLPVGLGFPNLTYIDRRILRLPFIRARSLPHEVLHNWWGNGVGVDYGSGNWSEGLTTYMADYALTAERGADKAREMRLGWLRDYAALPSERDRPVTAFTSKAHDAAQVIGYNKVAFIFHMLKREIGAEAFAAGLRRVWESERFGVAGWADLQQAFEAASGQDLGWFFEQWLSRTGAPRLTLEGVAKGEAGQGVTVSLRQAEPAYRLTVPVVVETDATVERHHVTLDSAEAAFRLDTKGEVRALHVDPGHDLFRRLLPDEAPPILRDVTLSAEAATVIAVGDEAGAAAARELAGRMLDAAGSEADVEDGLPGDAPLLLIGTTAEVEAALAAAGLEGTPASLAGRGTARVWTARRPGGQPLLAVAADDTEALAALLLAPAALRPQELSRVRGPAGRRDRRLARYRQPPVAPPRRFLTE